MVKAYRRGAFVMNMKKLAAVLISVAMIISTSCLTLSVSADELDRLIQDGVAVASDDRQFYFQRQWNGNGIVLYDKTKKDVVFPSSIKGENIDSIAMGACAGASNLETVEISEPIKEIEMMAFSNCPKLKTVKIPKSVTAIDQMAFDDVSSKNAVILCYSGSYAEEYAKSCSITYNLIDEGNSDTPKQPDPKPAEIEEITNPGSCVGDIDNDSVITSSDALSILRMSVGLVKYSSEFIAVADIDGDKEIMSSDALDVLRCSVGLSANPKIGALIK